VRLGIIGLSAVAALIAGGWRSQPTLVEHAVVPVGSSSVEIWRDPGDGELALQWQGADSWTLVRGRTVFRVTQARLEQLELFAASADLWRPIRLQYTLTPDGIEAALRSGNRVPRPSLMGVPNLDRPGASVLLRTPLRKRRSPP